MNGTGEAGDAERQSHGYRDFEMFDVGLASFIEMMPGRAKHYERADCDRDF